MLKSFFVTDRLPSKIELTFLFWTDTFKITRVIDAWIKKFSSEFIPETKDTLACSDWTIIIWWMEVTNEIIKRIWIWRDTFLRSVFAKQKDVEVLSWMAQDRKKLINSILWLDKIENSITILKQEEKEKTSYLNFIKVRLSEINIEELKLLKNEKNTECEGIKKSLKEKETKLKEINDKLINVKWIYDIEDKKREECNKATSSLDFFKKSILDLKKQNENIKNTLKEIDIKEKYLEENKFILEKEKKLNEELNKLLETKNLFKQKNDFEKNLKINLEKLDFLEKELNTFLSLDIVKLITQKEKQKEEEEKKNNILFEEKINLENNITYLRNEYEELKKEFDEIKKLSSNATCPTCLRPLEEHYPNLLKIYEEKLLTKATEGKSKKEILQKKEKEFLEFKQSFELLKKEISLLQEKEKKFIQLSEQKILKNNEIKEITEKLKDFWEIKYDEEIFFKLENEHKEIKILYDEYKKIEWEVRNKPKLELDLKEIIKKEEESLVQIKEKEEFLKNLNFDEKKYLEIKEEYFSINLILKSKNEEINSLNITKSKLDYELKEITTKIDNFKNDSENIKNIIDEVDYIKLKITILSDYIIYLLTYLKPRIEDLASDYFGVITDNKYNYITLDNEYNILIDNKNIDLFSWGERDLANLCLRLSLGQNLSLNRGNPINFLILDEVLWSQDKERQQNILINLKKLENKFSQIILISHLEEIKDLATNLIEVKQISKEESSVIYY
jgi:DNA repair protein SbcC/Rad50